MAEPSVSLAVQLRRLLSYFGFGVGIFALVSAWVFAGLKLWGNN